MLSLTQTAVDKVREAISQQEEPEAFGGIRVSVVGGGCSGFQYAMKLEENEAEGDQVIEVDGFKVFVDEQSSLYLEGTQIDYVQTVQGEGFKFNNPNVSGTCGCGESFQA